VFRVGLLLLTVHQLLKETLINRRDRWRKFQKHITSRARIQFFYLLSERGYRGKLLANHKEKKLDLLVRRPRAFSLLKEKLTRDRWSRMRLVSRPRATTPKGFPEAKSRSPPYVYFSQCGKQWGPRSVASTSCKWFFALSSSES